MERGKVPRIFTIEATKEQDLRYGETHSSPRHLSAAQCVRALTGKGPPNRKPLSYNNLLDTDAAWTAVREFSEPAVIILKHQNPVAQLWLKILLKRTIEPFRVIQLPHLGIIAANREIPLEFVEHFADIQKQFVEVLA